MATQTAPKGERNKGPIAVAFADATKEDFKRVPKGVTGVVITATKTGEKKTYSLSHIPTEVQHQLVMYAFATKAKQHVNNHADENDNMITLIDGVYKDLVEGKMYAKAAEGKGPGKKLDVSLYVDAMAAAMAFKAKKGHTDAKGSAVKAMTEDQKANFKIKLESMPKAERTEYVKKLMAKPLFQKSYQEIKSKRIQLDKEDDLDSLL